jgi:Winged helix domain, variant/ATPase family associated with various cellular activities (AAA)
MSGTINLERSYLQAVLSWLDARLEQNVRRWQMAGQDPADRFRGLYVSDAKALEMVRRGAGTQWGTGVELPEDEAKQLEEMAASALETMRALENEAEASSVVLRLKAVQTIFKLSDFEWQAFVLCLAPALDLRYERIYGYLQDDVTRTFASVDLLLNLLVPEGLFRLQYLPVFDRQSTLQTFRLIVPIEESGKFNSALRQAFRVEPGVVNWLLGAYSPSAELGEGAVLYAADKEATDLSATEIFSLPKMPDKDTVIHVKPMLSLHGPDILQQELTARQMAAALGRSLLEIKIASDEEQSAALERLYPAVRDAQLMDALLFVQGCDLFIDSEGCLLPSVFHILNLIEDTVITGSKRAFHFNPEMTGNDSPLMSVHFEKMTTAERAELWTVLLEGVADEIGEEEFLILSGQFNMTGGQIVAAASSAMSSALQKGRNLQVADLFEAARLHSGHHLADLARKIEPRYEWADLVLPETPITMLSEMVSMVQSRPLVLETWGLGRKLTAGAGVSALFSGPPGTGKTLAAQIMANQLGIDLYRIDLSTVVSKYIGETEKNLERIFREASESNAILFFDEADSIFGKRSEVKDAHDRYANIEVGYLLQRMEDYSGVAILATNLRANLDEAFTRRLQFIINFPFPDEEYRLRIWKVLMPPDLPVSDGLDFELLADRFKMAGGSIRNIIVSAAYLAAADGGVVTMDHLMHGTRREYQKMGRLLHDGDFSLSSSKGV